MSNIKERCKNRWPSLLPTMGIDRSFLAGQHGPCPLCGGKDRFRFDNKEGVGTYFCNACGAGDGFDLLMKFKGWDFATCAKELEKIVGSAEISQTHNRLPDKRVRDWMNDMWSGTSFIQNADPVGIYLSGRGLHLQTYPNGIRFHARCGYRHKDKSTTYHPAMLAKVMSPEGKPTTIHKTYLDSLGRKAQLPQVRQYMPISRGKGSAVRLGEPAEVMGVAEGIETALSASVIYKMPVWSALDAGGLMQWSPPPEAQFIHIFGDNDASNAGQSAANALAHRLYTEGKEFKIEIPDEPGDWNDFLQRNKCNDNGK